MKQLFDQVSLKASTMVTKSYSTSFSLGILFLGKTIRGPIYSIYGFVRFADEIVDSFHGYNKSLLLSRFKEDTYKAINEKISLNPILNSFQEVVNTYDIDHKWIDLFFDSMEMDLNQVEYNKDLYDKYILGSAESVGLMCLHVFTEGNMILFNKLRPFAMKLGAAFQKVNFLRDLKADNLELGRTYFPDVDMSQFSEFNKSQIEADIERDFSIALEGIKQLPSSSRKGVYLAYYYYYVLFKKIKGLSPQIIMSQRVRIPNTQKIVLMLKSHLRHTFNML